MMIDYPDRKFRWIHETVIVHFDFLFQQGFQVISVLFTDRGVEDWQVMMLLNDCFIRLYCDSGKVNLGISTTQLFDQVGFLDLSTLFQCTFDYDPTYDMTELKKKNEGQQIEEIALLFEKHFGDIFAKFDMLSNLIFDGTWVTLDAKNGRLSKDNLPFTLSMVRN